MKPQKPPQPLLIGIHRPARVVAGLQLLPVALDQAWGAGSPGWVIGSKFRWDHGPLFRVIPLSIPSRRPPGGRPTLATSEMGGSAYVAPRPSAVRLRRNSRPAARQQRHCATMVRTAQGPRLLDFRRIRLRCFRNFTKMPRATEAAIMSFLQDLSSLSSEPDSFAFIDIKKWIRPDCSRFL